MITNEGRVHVLRYLAGMTPSVGDALAVGVGTKAASESDSSLQFEVVRVPISTTSIDTVNGSVIFKGTMPDDFPLRVTEIGLWFSDASPDSTLITTFDEYNDAWEGGTFEESEDSRIGGSFLSVSPEAATPASIIETFEPTDLSNMLSPSDILILAIHKPTAGSVTFNFELTDSTGGSMSVASQPVTETGYVFANIPVQSATFAGGFDASSVVSIEIEATSSTSMNISYDGLSSIDPLGNRGDSVLVARTVIPEFTAASSTPADIEYEIEVNL